MLSKPSKEQIEIIGQELDLLEKNPINGWDLQYPNLFKFVSSSLEEVSLIMNCPTPGIVIRFAQDKSPLREAIFSYQATAILFTNNTQQLHIGADFLRSFVLNNEESKGKYKAFLWTIAHEIGHLNDPLFKMYGQSYYVRSFIDTFCVTFLFLWVGNLVAPNIISLPIHNLLLTIGIGTWLCKKTIIIVLHRKFEYTADAATLNNKFEFTSSDAKTALTIMIAQIKNLIALKNLAFSFFIPKILQSYFNRLIEFKIFMYHPKVENRVQALNSLSKRR